MSAVSYAYFETIVFSLGITFILSLVLTIQLSNFFLYKDVETGKDLLYPKAVVTTFALPFVGLLIFFNLECGTGEYERLTDIKNQAEHVKPEVTEKIKEFSKDGKITLFEYYVVSSLTDEISRRYKREKQREDYENAKINAIRP